VVFFLVMLGQTCEYWPNLRVLAVEVEPFFEPWLNVRLDGIDWAFRDALIQDE